MMQVLRLRLSEIVRKLQWYSRGLGIEGQVVGHTGKYSMKQAGQLAPRMFLLNRE